LIIDKKFKTMKQAAVLTIVSSSLLLCSTNAFSVLNKKNQLQQQRTSTILRAEDSDEPEKKIGLSGLLQLITAGMGSPFLGVSSYRMFCHPGSKMCF